ncbi:MAG: ABC transporter ATP-binding protein [Candidatus Brocadiia bacterium]
MSPPHRHSRRLEPETDKTKWELVKSSIRLFSYLKPYWHVAILLLLSSFVAIGLSLARPMLIGFLLDMAIVAKSIFALKILCLVILAIMLGTAILSFINSYFGHKVGHQVVLDVRNDLYSHLQSLSVRFYENRPTGEIMSRVVNDSESVEQLIVHSIQRLLEAFLTLMLIAVYMFVVNWRLAILALIPIPLIIVQISYYSPRFRKIFRNVREAIADLNTFLQERVSGVRIVKASANEAEEADSFREVTRECYEAFMRAVFNFSMFRPLMMLLMGSGTLLVMYFGGKMAIQSIDNPDFPHALTIGALVAFIMYTRRFYGPIRELGRLFGHSLPRSLAAADRIFEFLDEDEKLSIPPEPYEPETIGGAIEFKNVNFSYNEEKILRRINLRIESGETIALVGPSGVGKTTLVDLISRFYDPEDGMVLVDERNVREYEPSALRQHIGTVQQEPFLFNCSVRDNISYGVNDIDKSRIKAVAEEAGAAEFIEELPDRYDTIVGERGVKLSVGQKQRISIARALLRNPAILVLDEATSSVDTPTEQIIQEALERVAKNRTTIIIAHRLSTTTFADRIVVLEGGKIIETGKPENLLQKGGQYASLWDMQNIDLLPGENS